MTEYYQAVRDADDKCRNVVLTVIEGRFLGEKIFISNQKIIWKSEESGFFAGCFLENSDRTSRVGETCSADEISCGTDEMLGSTDEMFCGADEILSSTGKMSCSTDEMSRRINRIDEIDKITGINGCGICIIKNTAVFCEVLGQEKKIVVCGGGHVSIPMIQIGRMIGCRVCVLEDRPMFADRARAAGADEVFCEPFEQGLEKIEGDKDTFFVIVTRGHRYDQICLENILKKEHAYIGMMGSRKRAAAVKEAVIAHGADPDMVNRVYTPIGLRIGAQTPEEIAVSVMAQMIEVKNKTERSSGFPAEIIEQILNDKNKEPKVLATIVKRKGSAPREAGTKMLVLADGTCIGTIGGGCAEADILQKALVMIRENTKKAGVCHVDMTGSEAEEEGMVCGGKIDVLLEVI